MKKRLFEEKKIIAEKVGLLCSTFGIWPQGSVIPHDSIEATIGFGRYEGSYASIIRKFRRWMRQQRGIHVSVSTNKGFLLQTSQETITVESLRRQKKIYRAGDRTAKILSAVHTDGLSDHLLRQRALGIQHARQAKLSAGRYRREQQAEFARPETTPSVARRPTN